MHVNLLSSCGASNQCGVYVIASLEGSRPRIAILLPFLVLVQSYSTTTVGFMLRINKVVLYVIECQTDGWLVELNAGQANSDVSWGLY